MLDDELTLSRQHEWLTLEYVAAHDVPFLSPWMAVSYAIDVGEYPTSAILNQELVG
tara:strand:- start:50 stop:217 length:168 start_codon:yes stop_codon:yes gene_type:complete